MRYGVLVIMPDDGELILYLWKYKYKPFFFSQLKKGLLGTNVILFNY